MCMVVYIYQFSSFSFLCAHARRRYQFGSITLHCADSYLLLLGMTANASLRKGHLDFYYYYPPSRFSSPNAFFLPAGDSLVDFMVAMHVSNSFALLACFCFLFKGR